MYPRPSMRFDRERCAGDSAPRAGASEEPPLPSLASLSIGPDCDSSAVTRLRPESPIDGRSRSATPPLVSTAGRLTGARIGPMVSCGVEHTGAPRRRHSVVGSWVSGAGLPRRSRLLRPRTPCPRTGRVKRCPTRAGEDSVSLRRSDDHLCRLWRGVHPLRCRPGVLRTEGVRRRTPNDARVVAPAGARSRDGGLRHAGDRRPARLRARRRTTAREYFAVICSRCGNQAQVPFKPRMDRPVYCSDCFRSVSAG